MSVFPWWGLLYFPLRLSPSCGVSDTLGPATWKFPSAFQPRGWRVLRPIQSLMTWAVIPNSKGMSIHFACMSPKASQSERPRVVQMAPNRLLKSYLLPVPITLVYQQEDCFAQLMRRRCEGDECPPYWEGRLLWQMLSV